MSFLFFNVMAFKWKKLLTVTITTSTNYRPCMYSCLVRGRYPRACCCWRAWCFRWGYMPRILALLLTPAHNWATSWNGFKRTRAILYLWRPTRFHFQAWDVSYRWWSSGLRAFAFSGGKGHAKLGSRTYQNLWIAMSQSTDQILTRFLGVKCSSFQALSRAMKFGKCVCVCVEG